MELPITTKINEEDYKPEEDLENLDDINPKLLKIIEKHHNKIATITNTINISEFTGYISFLVFLVILSIRLSPKISFNWLILLAPAATCIISFTILLNAYLKLKDLFDESDNFEEEEHNTKNNNGSLGSILSYCCLNTASLSILVYLVMLTLKLQGILNIINFNDMAIPIYILYGIAVFYYIFIFPAFIKNKMIFLLFMFGLYIIASFIFFILLNMKLDKSIQGGYYSLVFFSMLLAIGLHMICFCYLIAINIYEKKNILNHISITIALLLLLVVLLLTGLSLDNVIKIDNWIPSVIAIFAYMILVSDKLYSFFDKNGNPNTNRNEQYFSNYSSCDSEKQF